MEEGVKASLMSFAFAYAKGLGNFFDISAQVSKDDFSAFSSSRIEVGTVGAIDSHSHSR